MMRLLVVAVALLGLSAQAPAYRAEIEKYRAARVAELTGAGRMARGARTVLAARRSEHRRERSGLGDPIARACGEATRRVYADGRAGVVHGGARGLGYGGWQRRSRR